MNTPIEDSSHLLSIRSSPVVRMLHKILWNTIRPSEHPLRTIALQILVCLHYGCSQITSNIHQYLLTLSFWSYWFNMSVNARNHRLILLNYHSGSDVILNMSWFSANGITVDCTPKSIQLIHPWSEHLLLILRFGIIIPLHLSFELFRWFHNLLHLHSFISWLSTNTHISLVMDC